MLIPLGILASAGGVPPIVSDYELIESAILTSNQPSVVFSNLGTYASTYKHLQLRMVARTTNSAQQAISARLNGDTNGSNYATHRLTGTGSAVVSADAPSQGIMWVGLIPGSNTGANEFGSSVFDLLDPYSTTKNKTGKAMAGQPAHPEISFYSSAWFNTNAVSSITLFPFGAAENFVAGSRFSIYGVK
jgi:hypothetical protein